MNHLLKYKNDTLSQLMVLCGANSKPTKTKKINQILHTLNYHLQLPPIFNILAVDIGIKNFSYCKLGKVGIYNPVYNLDFDNWKAIDLNQKYQGKEGEFDSKYNELVNMKMKIGFLNYSVFKDLIIDTDLQPDIVLIENQRVKSNNNQVTLPTILLNHIFEHMFYANYQTLKHYHSLNCQLISMNSNRLTNFIINRFLDKSQINSKNSKILRNKYWFNLLENEYVNLQLPADHDTMDTKSFLKLYNETAIQQIKKADDLFDSFLYNMSFIENFQNNMYLDYYLRKDLDLNELVWKLNNNSVYKLRKIEGLIFNEYSQDLGYELAQLPDLKTEKKRKKVSLYEIEEEVD